MNAPDPIGYADAEHDFKGWPAPVPSRPSPADEAEQADYTDLIRAAYVKGHADGRRWQADAKTRAREQSQVERARWGPGGRKHFADPRPGDFPGREHEREAEAG